MVTYWLWLHFNVRTSLKDFQFPRLYPGLWVPSLSTCVSITLNLCLLCPALNLNLKVGSQDIHLWLMLPFSLLFPVRFYNTLPSYLTELSLKCIISSSLFHGIRPSLPLYLANIILTIFKCGSEVCFRRTWAPPQLQRVCSTLSQPR